MSATRDKSQKIAFVYTNFYQIYKKGLQEQNQAQTQIKPFSSGQVLKANDLHQEVKPFVPVEFIGKKAAPRAPQNEALKSLRENLNTLNQLHARLRFMLKELEELTKK